MEDIDAGGEAPHFTIPAMRERRTRALKHGDTFAMFDNNGDVTAALGSPEGIFHRDTRHLSHLALSICGQRPILLSSTLRDDNGRVDFAISPILICESRIASCSSTISSTCGG